MRTSIDNVYVIWIPDYWILDVFTGPKAKDECESHFNKMKADKTQPNRSIYQNAEMATGRQVQNTNGSGNGF